MVVERPARYRHSDPRFNLLILIAAARAERRDRRFVSRDVGSARAGVTGSIEAA